MKVAALSLALVMSAVQTVGWVECCCVLVCKHQNDPCKECGEKANGPAPEACCDESRKPAKSPSPDHAGANPQGEGGCAHVQPSSEVASHAAPLPPVILDVVLELPVVPFQPAPAECEKTTSLFSRARGSPPLHLLNSVLLI